MFICARACAHTRTVHKGVTCKYIEIRTNRFESVDIFNNRKSDVRCQREAGKGGGRGTGEGEKLLSHSDIRKLTDKTRSKLDLFAFRLQALRIFPEGRKVE